SMPTRAAWLPASGGRPSVPANRSPSVAWPVTYGSARVNPGITSRTGVDQARPSPSWVATTVAATGVESAPRGNTVSASAGRSAEDDRGAVDGEAPSGAPGPPWAVP